MKIKFKKDKNKKYYSWDTGSFFNPNYLIEIIQPEYYLFYHQSKGNGICISFNKWKDVNNGIKDRISDNTDFITDMINEHLMEKLR